MVLAFGYTRGSPGWVESRAARGPLSCCGLLVGGLWRRSIGLLIRSSGVPFSVRELQETFTPTDDDVAWAREKSRTEHHLLLGPTL